eukprot:CAMPEP_0183787766 /NCGR_PEP_ID=MMETSP0739-20130205/67712_1 /TAXON_ID=385413 /ORGANISM="Thalassiosira miniscula, Strain CCMP1093" /LENGTH=459 /DNA_ID=CAMNT_0026031859 /DNA_START=58 /DNA_END=1438 /DNA_ORIENTATION=-
MDSSLFPLGDSIYESTTLQFCDKMWRRRLSGTYANPTDAAVAAKAKNTIFTREKAINESSNESWILLVEDEDELRNAIGKYLAKEGYYVTGVSDARGAILVLRGIVRPTTSSRNRFVLNANVNQHQNGLGSNATNNNATHHILPDCVVLDIRLGTTDGLELLTIIRSDPTLENLPVVLLTAKGKVEDRIRGYEVGADAYLPKPFDPEELLSILDVLLKNKLSVIGDAGGSVNPKHNHAYGDLMRELMEIKSLMQELGAPDKSTDSDDSSAPLDSLHDELLELKQSVSQIVLGGNNAENGALTEQYNSMSILTPEETMIINNVCRGMSNKDIAAEMQCSVSKIEKHVSALFKKAAVKRRADLAAWWKNYVSDKTTKANDMDINETTVLEDRPPNHLTADEETVMDLLGQGKTPDEIISETKLRRRDIKKMLDNLFKKAHVTNRTELLQWWSTSKKEITNA